MVVAVGATAAVVQIGIAVEVGTDAAPVIREAVAVVVLVVAAHFDASGVDGRIEVVAVAATDPRAVLVDVTLIRRHVAVAVVVQAVAHLGGAGVDGGLAVVAVAGANRKSVAVVVVVGRPLDAVAVGVEAVTHLRRPGVHGRFGVIAVGATTGGIRVAVAVRIRTGLGVGGGGAETEQREGGDQQQRAGHGRSPIETGGEMESKRRLKPAREIAVGIDTTAPSGSARSHLCLLLGLSPSVAQRLRLCRLYASGNGVTTGRSEKSSARPRIRRCASPARYRAPRCAIPRKRDPLTAPRATGRPTGGGPCRGSSGCTGRRRCRCPGTPGSRGKG